MQSPLPQISTTILLLIHLGCGCCFHHAHACETACCPTPIAAAGVCPCGTHKHDEVHVNFVNGPKDVAERGHDGKQHQCDGDSCSFVPSTPAPEQIGEVASRIGRLEVVTTETAAAAYRSGLNRTLNRRLPIAGYSLRTHLGLRIWQI